MKCNFCSHETGDDAEICPGCNKKVSKAKPPPPPKKAEEGVLNVNTDNTGARGRESVVKNINKPVTAADIITGRLPDKQKNKDALQELSNKAEPKKPQQYIHGTATAGDIISGQTPKAQPYFKTKITIDESLLTKDKNAPAKIQSVQHLQTELSKRFNADPASTVKIIPTKMEKAPLYGVNLYKFAILSTLSLGLYQFFVYYYHWFIIEKNHQLALKKALLWPVYAKELFSKINGWAHEEHIDEYDNGFLNAFAAASVILWLLGLFVSKYFLFVSAAPLFLMQKKANKIILSVTGDMFIDNTLRVKEFLICCLGLFLFAHTFARARFITDTVLHITRVGSVLTSHNYKISNDGLITDKRYQPYQVQVAGNAIVSGSGTGISIHFDENLLTVKPVYLSGDMRDSPALKFAHLMPDAQAESGSTNNYRYYKAKQRILTEQDKNLKELGDFFDIAIQSSGPMHFQYTYLLHKDGEPFAFLAQTLCIVPRGQTDYNCVAATEKTLSTFKYLD